MTGPMYDLEYTEGSKGKIIIEHDQNIKELWDNLKRLNLRNIRIEEKNIEPETEGIKNILNEIVIENLSHIKTEINIHT